MTAEVLKFRIYQKYMYIIINRDDSLHVIKIPSAKQDSAFFTAIWVNFMQLEAVSFVIRPLTTKPSPVTANSQLLVRRSSKVVTKVLFLLKLILELLQCGFKEWLSFFGCL